MSSTFSILQSTRITSSHFDGRTKVFKNQLFTIFPFQKLNSLQTKHTIFYIYTHTHITKLQGSSYKNKSFQWKNFADTALAVSMNIIFFTLSLSPLTLKKIKVLFGTFSFCYKNKRRIYCQKSREKNNHLKFL